MSRGESATPLGKVRGIGSAHEGGHHWLEERFTSVVLVLLSLWLIFSLLMGALVVRLGYTPFFVGLAVLDLVGAVVLWTVVREPQDQRPVVA